MAKLEDKLMEALTRAMVAEKIADKALAMAQEALVKVEAMKQSTHKVELINPMTQEQQSLLEEVKEVMMEDGTRPDSEEVPVKTKLSPFTVFNRVTSQDVTVAKSPDYQSLLEEEGMAQEALWDMSVNDGV